MSVEVVLPLQGECAHRQRAARWVHARYAQRLPRWLVTFASGRSGPWVKAAAVMPAVHSSAADVLVVADADVWCDDIDDTVHAVEAGARWAIPHRDVMRLTAAGTEQLIAGQPQADDLEEPPYPGLDGGGIVVARRRTLLEVPLDPRFEGWGQEDESWGLALQALLGPPWRGAADLLHLYHPPQPRTDRLRGSTNNLRLGWRYHAAAEAGPDAVRALLAEIPLDDNHTDERISMSRTAPHDLYGFDGEGVRRFVRGGDPIPPGLAPEVPLPPDPNAEPPESKLLRERTEQRPGTAPQPTLGMPELRKRAGELGIPVPVGTTKPQLADLVATAENAPPAPAA